MKRIALAVALIALALGGRGADAADLTKLKVGAYSSVSDAGLYIAKDKGYFAEQGFDVDFVQVNSGAVMLSQLATGGMDASGGAPGAALYNAARQGMDVRIVADKGSTLPGHGYFAFVVRKDLADKIKTAADLRGRVLAVTGFKVGASSEVTIDKLLRTGGVKWSEVNVINMAFPDILAGLGTGKVDVGVLIEPLVTEAEEKGIGVIWKRTDTLYPNQQYGALMYGQNLVNHPDLGVKFMIAYLKGVRFYNDALSGKASRDELVDILVRNTSVKDRAIYQKMVFPGIDPDGKLNLAGMQSDTEWWLQEGSMKQPVPVSSVADTSFAAKAVQQLGPYR
ncbi:MAG TPA: ABC transporter substrate-binding protein [Magnetospirillaceae bacterium]|jgi:NitT/TauT family transport system substrate-binding protein